jgi:protein Mpv17
MLAVKPKTPAFLVAKILVDSFVFGPIYLLAFYAWGSALIDRTGVEGFKAKITQDFVPTMCAELAIWPLFQAFNFSVVPVQHQLLAVNAASLVDATFLSW